MKISRLLASLLLTAATGAVLAQTPPAPAPATPHVDQRETRQQDRIEQGVASGQLNAKETERLQSREARLDGAEAKAKADGTVTRAERVRLNRMAERDSRAIRRQKHDRQHVSPAS